jgi:hypothetical protein
MKTSDILAPVEHLIDGCILVSVPGTSTSVACHDGRVLVFKRAPSSTYREQPPVLPTVAGVDTPELGKRLEQALRAARAADLLTRVAYCRARWMVRRSTRAARGAL